MEVRYHLDPDTGLPHIYGHGVTEEEVDQVLRGPGEDLPAERSSRMKPDHGRALPPGHLRARRGSPERFCRDRVRAAGQGEEGVPSPTTEEAAMKEPKYPPGWDEERVRQVIAHYDAQTEDEQFAEIEAAREAEDVTLIAVPTELVPDVRALLAQKQSA
jgi:hypothetical protein